jgi:hypothetical protein
VGKVSSRDARKFEAIDRLYARLPVVACRRLCGDACGPILLTELEARRLHVTAHAKPRTIPLARVDGSTSERCVYLTARGLCAAYDVRPLICRVWGVVKALSCPHGCVPDSWLDDLDFVFLAQAIERIGGNGTTCITTPEGAAVIEGGGFTSIPTKGIRPADVRAADAELTRSLRAIFGGRIIAAVTDNRATTTTAAEKWITIDTPERSDDR